jgi:hypothetical protein
MRERADRGMFARNDTRVETGFVDAPGEDR